MTVSLPVGLQGDEGRLLGSYFKLWATLTRVSTSTDKFSTSSGDWVGPRLGYEFPSSPVPISIFVPGNSSSKTKKKVVVPPISSQSSGG